MPGAHDKAFQTYLADVCKCTKQSIHMGFTCKSCKFSHQAPCQAGCDYGLHECTSSKNHEMHEAVVDVVREHIRCAAALRCHA